MRTTESLRRLSALLILGSALAACGDDAGESTPPEETPEPPAPIVFGQPGSLTEESGRGGFAFGAATAATQIEDNNIHTDWHRWSQRVEDGGLGQGKEFVGDAVGTFSNPEMDLALIEELGLDDYRFSIEWARIEPVRGEYDEEALAHYDAFIDRLVEMGVRPSVTLHHFSNPVWVTAPGEDCPEDGPIDSNLCGWDNPEGVEEILVSIKAFAELVAERYGDRVDHWVTFNEPMNYIVAAYGAGYFPPGRNYVIQSVGQDTDTVPFQKLVGVFRAVLQAHVAMYDAIKEKDTVDADGDGQNAAVGMALNSVDWRPARDNKWSDHPDDIAAADRMHYFYHFLFADSLRNGTFDPDLDLIPDEQHPEWTGKLDWLGLQYYFRDGVTAKMQLIPGLKLFFCFEPFDFGSCVRTDKSKWIPTMSYEWSEEGIYEVLMRLKNRYSDLPIVITESGLAANNDVRRSEHIVRTLEQIKRAIDDGADVRGYYHWSLTDNFEWHLGYGPHFGLYKVDREDNMRRDATHGAITYRAIIENRTISTELRELHGGTGPMSPEFADDQK